MRQEEITVNNIQALEAALAQGEQWIEVYAPNGVTPSLDLVAEALATVANTEAEIIVGIRPRLDTYNFSYQDIERVMWTIKELRTIGVQHVSFGCLTCDNELARDRMLKLVEAASTMQVHFDTAFDVIPVPKRQIALDWLAQHGVEQVMTNDINLADQYNCSYQLAINL